MVSEDFHISVMVHEIRDFLRVVIGGLYVDCTLGGGGHSLAILERGGNIIGIDRDQEAVLYATTRLEQYRDRVTFHVGRFSDIDEIVGSDSGSVDGVVMDLGMSSRMIDDPSRGFSYRKEGPLLMTMESGGETAFDIVNRKSVEELTTIFSELGEERNAHRIACAIVRTRSSHPIETTSELADIVEKTVGPRMPQKSKARVFQALRIYINKEIEEMKQGLNGAVHVMKQGGRLCVISYHSIEDRVVKDFLKTMYNPCICPPDLPVCRCGKKSVMKCITRKPLRPSHSEVARNPRSHSALLRVGEKVKTT